MSVRWRGRAGEGDETRREERGGKDKGRNGIVSDSKFFVWLSESSKEAEFDNGIDWVCSLEERISIDLKWEISGNQTYNSSL